MYRYIILFLSFILVSCYNTDDIKVTESKRIDNVVNITSYGTFPQKHKENLRGKSRKSKAKKAYSSDDTPFIETREFESSESVVLSHLSRYIYPGSILEGNSIQNLNYKPIRTDVNPITVSLSIPSLNNSASIVIKNPSLSETRREVNKYLKDAVFTQNGELSYSIEQFSSYEELKVAFGANVNTVNLFGSKSSSEAFEESLISKSTGFYVKFQQTSFTLDMDIPTNLVDDINLNTNGIEPVYVSSISYGRMGILTIETDEDSEKSRQIINSTFNKLFYNKQTSLTQEERNFLDRAEYKLLLIGGNSTSAVQSFKGYEAFVNHISQGTFSKEAPGVPILCSYSYLKDNSPVKTTFKFDIRKPPLFIELFVEPNDKYPGRYSKSGDLNLFFYKSKSKIPTIPPRNVKIFIERNKKDLLNYTSVKDTISTTNFSRNTSLKLRNYTLKEVVGEVLPPRYGGPKFKVEESYEYEYKLVNDKQNNYVIIK